MIAGLPFTGLWGTEYTYVDINNGQLKKCQTTCGLSCRTKIQETDYSILVSRLGLTKSPDWILAHGEEQGLRRWFYAQNICCHGGRLVAIMDVFAKKVELGEVDDPKNEILHLRDLATPTDHFRSARDYVNGLVKRKPSETP